MSNDKPVKDVMVSISRYPHVPHWFSINKAVKIVKLSLHNVKEYPLPMAILVLDDKYNLMGTLTLRDILKAVEEAKESKEALERPISEIMIPAKFFVEPNDPVTKAASLMIHNNLELLPVVLESKKKFLGLVRMLEIFNALSNDVVKE